MRILQVHNEYQHFGGEEVVVAAECTMLKAYGHEVDQYIVRNLNIDNSHLLKKAKMAAQSVWSYASYKSITRKLKDFNPDVVHVHNTIPLISASVYSACNDLNIPVVHTLHNYKLICPGSYLYRNDRICEDCIGKQFLMPAISNKCYRGSRAQTVIASTGLIVHRFLKTYTNKVDIFIALNTLARQKFIKGGLPAEKIAVKPNFITSDISAGQHQGGYALFVGKLVQYKGIETLIKAWRLMDQTIPLKVIGQGPLEILLKSNLPYNVEYLGKLPREQVVELMQNASLLIFPSEWYEPFGMVVAEAFATGLPVIASRVEGITELVREGYSGWTFNPGSAEDLAHTVQTAWANPEEIQRRGALARQQYENYYSLEKNYQMTMSIYETAIARHGKSTLAKVF